jgi:hypothetical protein
MPNDEIMRVEESTIDKGAEMKYEVSMMMIHITDDAL